jgi:hypothetical protein
MSDVPRHNKYQPVRRPTHLFLRRTKQACSTTVILRPDAVAINELSRFALQGVNGAAGF